MEGKRIRTVLNDQSKSAGNYIQELSLGNVTGGMYFFTFRTDDNQSVHKITVLD